MNYWRMSFRVGTYGIEMWPECKLRGIAAIAYWIDGKQVVGDCSKITEDEYDEMWRKKDPQNRSSRSSLKNLAYRMKVGDAIFVKQGPFIVGRGIIKSEYQFDPKILKGTRCEWPHFVKVDWERNFRSIKIVLGADRHTVLALSDPRLKMLEAAIKSSDQENLLEIVKEDLNSQNSEESSFIEGGKKKHFTNYYERNLKLRTAAIQFHKTKCIICGFDFESLYGMRGTGYIEVHHLYPVSGLEKETEVNPKTDMTVVCSNCHRMIHRKKNDVLTIEEMRKLVHK